MNKDITSITAMRLKELRVEKGLSQRELRDAIVETYGVKMSRDVLVMYETIDTTSKRYGRNAGMRIEYLRCFADYFGVTSDYLLGLSDMRTTPINRNALKLKQFGMRETCLKLLKEIEAID